MKAVFAKAEVAWKAKSGKRRLVAFLFALISVVVIAGCADGDDFSKQGITQIFTQDYNPEYLDVLWVIDDRSPMNNIRERMITEAQSFFTRLDSATASYRMGVVTADMQFAQGALQPRPNGVIIQKNQGTVGERATLLGSILRQTINLGTGGEDEGLAASLMALQSTFVPRAGVPLVLVFISYSDDHSLLPQGVTSGDVATIYGNAFLNLKGGDSKLLRVYSINYVDLPSTSSADYDRYRCAQRFNADRDNTTPGFFQDRYFRLAERFSVDLTDPTRATADLCGSFASNIDLSGLKLLEPKKRFRLDGVPREGSVTVAVTVQGQIIDGLQWTFDVAKNEIVFATFPPDGSTIQVTYFTD